MTPPYRHLQEYAPGCDGDALTVAFVRRGAEAGNALGSTNLRGHITEMLNDLKRDPNTLIGEDACEDAWQAKMPKRRAKMPGK